MNNEIFDLDDASIEQIKILHNKYLEILKYFDEFCSEHDLRYSLLGGTLIGAVRHQGFIPWDDDVDIMMPRPDYEKLYRIWNTKSSCKDYVIVKTDEKHNYHDAGMAIKDKNTTFINKHSINEDIVHGIGIEIMPIDAAAPTRISRIFQLLHAFNYALFNTQRLPDNKGVLIRILTRIIYFLVPSSKLRYKLWKYSENKMKKYDWKEAEHVTELIGSIKGMLITHPKNDFENTIRMQFEDLSLQVIQGYDRYLTMIFGNYMELPPKEERRAKHDVVYINTKESYVKFRNKYYLID